MKNIIAPVAGLNMRRVMMSIDSARRSAMSGPGIT
jgi:hypothetical protein